MGVIVDLYSNTKNEINRFLNSFYGKDFKIQDKLKWEIHFKKQIESADIIGAYIDNNENFKISMWVSLDDGFFINVTNYNADKIIRYLFERYPY